MVYQQDKALKKAGSIGGIDLLPQPWDIYTSLPSYQNSHQKR